MSNDIAIASLKEKIDDLNQHAWEVRVTDLPKSLELSQESVKLARSINYPKGLAEGLRSLGFSYVRFFKNDEAAPLLKESLSLYQSLNDLKGQAVIYEYLGIIERNWGNLGASLDLLLRANEIVLQTGPPEVEITCSYQLGVTYKHLGNHENALDYLYQTLSLAKKINSPLMEAYATNIIGSIYFDNGNYNQALDCYQQGLPIRRQSHDKWGEAGSLDNIGFTYLKLNELDKAIDYCKQSLAICQDTGDKKGEANALLHLGEIYEQAGDIKQAAGFSNESLEIRKARGDKRGETEVLLFLADLYNNRNDVEDHQIFEWLSDALRISDEIKAQDLLSKAYYNLHEYYQQKGNFKESLVQLEAHFQIEKELHKNSINQKIANLEISHKAETISQRNKELTELNEKIEKANEELKIERSLERVRTVAMAMTEPADMLEVCKIISDQLEILDVKNIRNVQTAIFYEEKNAYMNYEYYAKHEKLLITEVDYNNHPVAEKFANQMLKGPNQVWTHGFNGEEVKDWLRYQRSTNVFIDTYLETADSLNYYWYSLGPVALGMSTYISLNENEIDLFKRFRNVFELAYRRYLDIEKAEAQAREAQVELALERVRARTMAMHYSGELADTASVLFQQIKELGFETWSCGFCTWTKDDLVEVWMAADSGGLLPPMMIPYKEEPTHSNIYEASLRGEQTHDKVWEGIELEKHYAFLKTIPSVKEAIEILERSGLSLPSRQCYYVGFFKQGYLLLITKEPNADLKDLSKRFAKVFEQTYTRFLDLQKAESQAREAKIEAALERARTQSMIMQHSKELDDTLRVFHEQVLLLGIKSAFSFLWLPDEEKDRHIFWAAWAENNSTVFKSKAIDYPLDRNEPATAQCLVDWKGKEPVVSYHVTPTGVENYFAAWQELIAGVEKLKPKYFSGGLYYVEAFMKYGCFGVMVESELPEDEKKILSRFAVEFERTYTRFLDLQKAEAQAREAQIEVALERIRARAMAMHSSNELMDVANILREQMGLLDQPDLETSVVNLFEEDSELIFSWNASRVPGSSEKIISSITSFPKNSSELTREMMSHYYSKEKEYTLEAAGLKLMEFLKVLIEANPRVADYIGNNPPEKVFYHFTTFTGGNLLTVSYQPPSEETKSLQRRAASVFDMAYRRYLDLKKAEAQAREAQIEVALERVRAKVMAMTNSKDLNETSLVFGEQLRKLNVDWQFSYFWLIDESKNENTFWITWPDYKTSLTTYTLTEAAEYFNDCLVAWRGGVKIHDNYVPPESVQEWLDTFQRVADDAGGMTKEIMVASTFPTGVYYYDAMMKYGSFGICISKPATDEEKRIQCRFAIEFERAYSRFLDLKQAEAQTREAKIEASLERVRAKAMAMHKSDDFNDAVAIVFEELDKLNLGMLRCGIGIFNKEKRSAEVWTTTIAEHGSTVQVCGDESMDLHPLLKGDFAAWLRQEDFSYVLEGEDMSEYYRAVMETNFKLPESQIMVEHPEHLKQLYYAAMFESGSMFAFRETDFPEEAKVVMKRFAGVFNLTYKRFLDLQKAEAQTRESQIELGLERVRAKAMAMQKSDELKELIGTVYTELTKLDLILDRCFIMIYDNKSMGVTWWMSNPEAPLQPIGLFVKYHEQAPYLAFIKGWKERNLKWQYVLEGEVKKTWDKFLFVETELSQLPDFVITNMKANEKVYLSASFNNFGCLTLATLESLSDEHFDIMLRFAKVFDLTYTRFNDLKQAEAQAREAKIEVALERVRAKAMAMHKSEDLNPAVATVFEELDKLNIGILRCGIAIMDKEKPRGDVWITVKSEQSNTIQVSGDESLDYHPLLRGAYDGWLKQEDFSYVLQGEDLISYYRDVASIKYQLPVSTSFDTEKKDQQQYYYNSVFQDGSLFAFMETAITVEAQTVIKRFANVFNLTYKRFLDLQKAEAQAKEAQIELGLERVRARAMAMQNSDELNDLVAILLEELTKLDLILARCIIWIFDNDELSARLWMANSEDKKAAESYYIKRLQHSYYEAIIKGWKVRNPKWVYDLKGDEKKTIDRLLLNETELSRLPDVVKNGILNSEHTIVSGSFNNFGLLEASGPVELSAEQMDIVSRFAKAFDLTYTRFNDLKQAEAQTRQAKIEAALERVRARALAMQEPEELKDVAQVLRTEMGLLGVEELETCSIYINDEATGKTECWYALKDSREAGKKLVSDHFPLNLNDTWVGREMKNFYGSDSKQVSIVMQGADRKEWINYCEERSVPFRGYYGEVIPDRTYHLYKFSHGAIGAAAAGDISAESWKLLSRAASVFSLAYSRFKDLTQARNDLIQLKEEKKRAEDALTELQATQKQLIQSEKMASLGELTAGIAHEIQNPLNFVNNFSDVSNELLEEMKTELEKGNAEGAKEIAIDVKENLEKILHHGKRADAIVKGMLQHSRSSSGQKELTDINVLAEEYLRLAYHGLRAKDKFFNAKFETHLDPSITKINIVPQEIGRVILNMINNSFYAVSEKKKLIGNDYEPIVTVSTKNIKPPLGGLGVIEIRVSDNGNGIPKKALDKIFQPFFTTKPTGQGTGLGLSLSYDIVTKGHDGEIKVETKEGEGSAFTISLPMK